MGREPNIMLTKKQVRLLEYLEYRRRHRLPTVQQDLAEALGIRRDSANKLLARTRKRLARQGRELVLPPRHGTAAAKLVTLSD